MKQINVNLGSRSYSVLVEDGLLECAGDLLAPFAGRGRLAVVTDENVWLSLGGKLTTGLQRCGIEIDPIVLPAGEETKSWEGLASLIQRLLSLELGRESHIIAFGGGVVGDLTGFAAAVLKRGCGYIQIPTTLLAQVDSSVGGKTGINTGAGKNLVGAFHQPSIVLVDPSVLDSLPLRQLRAGYAEVVKYGLIGDSDFFHWCEEHGSALLAGDSEARIHAIAKSLTVKTSIVAEDELETTGRRALLNLGHTFGHALEAEAGYSDTLLHGEAVAIGLILAFAFSADLGLCSAADAARVRAHLASVKLPTDFAADPAALVRRIRQDKKAIGIRVPFILARGIGEAFVCQSIELEAVEQFLARQLRQQ